MSFSQPVQNEMMIFSGDVTSQLDTGWLTLSFKDLLQAFQGLEPLPTAKQEVVNMDVA